MSSPIAALLALLDLEPLGGDRFRGRSPPHSGRHLYGGQAVAQALVAATRTAPADRFAHSLHAYFVLAGDARKPVDFAVERIRDGGSFTTRRCVATQDAETIFSLEASFQRAEEGFEHFTPMPQAPSPESSLDAHAIAQRFQGFLPKPALQWLDSTGPLDMRVVAPEALFGASASQAQQLIWFRLRGEVPSDRATHAALLAYLSDMTLLNAALAPHGRMIFDPAIQAASLDHALWLHRDFRVDEWLLFAQESPAATGARALTRGQIFTSDGRLVASVAQEGLLRLRGDKN